VDDEAAAHGADLVGRGGAHNAGPTLLSLGGFGQNDVPSMGFLAWRRADAIGHCLDPALAILAALGARHAAERQPPPALAPLVDEVRAVFPPVEAVRPLGPDGDALASAFAQRVYRGPVAAADIARA
jgi:hypothetical protein